MPSSTARRAPSASPPLPGSKDKPGSSAAGRSRRRARVRAWDDVSKPGPEGAKWLVDDQGILNGSEPRGTWLVSEKEYGDFVLEFDWKLGERGNSGCGIRFPGKGDPAFDGLEIQMVDER